MPSLEFTEVSSEIGDSVSFSYKPGIAALKESNLYNMYASLVIMAKEGALPAESYVKIGEAIYKTNERGAIIIPLGEANVAHSLTLRFIAESLMTSGKGIDLDFKVFMTPDASKPFMTQNVYTEMLALGAKPLPSAEYTLAGGRIYYLGELSEPVAINLESVNLDKFNVEWNCLVLSGDEYVPTNLISVSPDDNGSYKLSFANNIAQGTYRITLVVTDKADESIVHINVPYSFVVMPK
jgi:hypothetical protein